MIKKSKWIAVIGIDGTGKTTMCRYIMHLLGKKAEFMKIPYYDWVREMIKISGDNSPTGDAYTDSLIFSAGSRLEMYKIREILKKKKFLVTQRSWLDTFPYRIAQGFTAKQVIHQLKPEGFRKPDIIFFLKCDHKTAYNRIKNKNGDKYEKLGPMKLHEKEFNNMINAILDNAFPIKFRNTKIFVVNSSESLTKMKKEVRMKLMDNKIIARDYK